MRKLMAGLGIFLLVQTAGTGCENLALFNGAFLGTGGTNNVDSNDADDMEDSNDDDSTDDENTGNLPEFGIAGSLKIAPTAKRRAMASDGGVAEGYTVYASSNATGESYEGTTDAEGNFSIDIPTDEAGNTFVVTIVNPLGHAEGPVLMGQEAFTGVTGLALGQSTTLGAINLPENPSAESILIGDNNSVGNQQDASQTARLDVNGVPVGVASLGKGDDAAFGGGGGAGKLDDDQDGLIDIFDADNDGNGIVDDFEGAHDFGGILANAGFNVDFFMNLKIADEDADLYYNGTPDAIDAALAVQTVITFEVVPDATGKEIIGVHLAKFPAPAYLESMTILVDTGFSLVEEPWSDSDYAFEKSGDRWQAFVVPNDLIQAGDLFAVLVDFADGTSIKYRRMINYVFKNIPRLTEHGTPVSQTPYAGGTVDFDGTQDVVLTFEPPIDETGSFLTGFDYFFEIFYYDANGAQIHDANWNATFGSLIPPGFDNGKFVVTADQLGSLSAGNTYTVTLPLELFVDTIVRQDSTTEAVVGYKIDIAAQNSGNAAIMLPFQKQ